MLTPLDIRKQEFKKAFRGYDRDEVDAFLEMVADEFERIAREDFSLRERVKGLEDSLKRYKDLEKALQETLMAAQTTADETRANAKREAELIMKEAEIRAERWTDEARAELNKIKEEITNLKMQKESFIARLKSFTTSQMELLKTLELEEQRPAFQRETEAES
ncbi:MAG TPA: DivIVA domain-containing protein [Candidatus Latescibacteria bacterium]|nr:DivIVA domain-containing protein [Candidatus Latescibacterota bacterium]